MSREEITRFYQTVYNKKVKTSKEFILTKSDYSSFGEAVNSLMKILNEFYSNNVFLTEDQNKKAYIEKKKIICRAIKELKIAWNLKPQNLGEFEWEVKA